MPAGRVVVLTLFFCAVGVALVCIRNEQVRCMADLQRLQLEGQALRREMHRQQLRIARLRAPDLVAERVQRLSLDLFTPLEVLPGGQDNHEYLYALTGP